MRYHKFPRLYVEQELTLGNELKLSQMQSHYLISVMRRKLADKILLFNGKAGEFLAEISQANKKSVAIKLIEKTRDFKPSPKINLIFSPVKNAKSEFIVQKATELGAAKIIPCIFERTVKSKVKRDKLEVVSIEAAEQCERLDIPVISELGNFSDVILALKDKNIIFCDETGKGKPMSEALSKLPAGEEYYVVIGPEGGFSDSEIDKIYSYPKAIGVGMGPRILRADTAIITALALVQNYLGDYGDLPDFRKSCNIE